MTEHAQPTAPVPSLNERLVDQTRQWLVEAATDLLEEQPEVALVNAAIAQRAGVSERTVYRHFPTREALLDAVAREAARRLAVPSAPATLAELLAFPAALFASFEARPQLTRAALKPEVFVRMRDGQAAQRWAAIQALMDRDFAQVSPEERRLATANIRYWLSATTWRYYRDNFGFDADETVRSVETALRHTVAGLAQAGPAK
jgi:AcrR family transcriptional regulator